MFPFKIYESDVLKDALCSFELPKTLHKKLRKLFQDRTFRKAVLYIFWVFVALKFKDASFGDIDHYNGTDETTLALKKDNRRELYRLMKEDIETGKRRRVSFIKYWRSKFQTHIFEAR